MNQFSYKAMFRATCLKYSIRTLMIFLIISHVHLQAQTGPGGIILGERSAFMLVAPEGWLLDLQLAQSEGVSAAFRSTDPKVFPGVIIFSFSATKCANFHTLAEYLDFDRKQMEARAVNITTERKPDIQTLDGKKAEVSQCSYSRRGKEHIEAVAHLEANEAINLIVLNAPTKELYEKALPAFESIVKSYGAESTVEHQETK